MWLGGPGFYGTSLNPGNPDATVKFIGCKMTIRFSLHKTKFYSLIASGIGLNMVLFPRCVDLWGQVDMIHVILIPIQSTIG